MVLHIRSLESLPREIIDAICSYLDTADILQLRCCRALAHSTNYAYRQCFASISASCTYKGLERLSLLSRQITIAQTIKEVTVSATSQSLHEFYRDPRLSIARGDQHVIDGNEWMRERLAAIFAALPRLQSVSINNGSTSHAVPLTASAPPIQERMATNIDFNPESDLEAERSSRKASRILSFEAVISALAGLRRDKLQLRLAMYDFDGPDSQGLLVLPLLTRRRAMDDDSPCIHSIIQRHLSDLELYGKQMSVAWRWKILEVASTCCLKSLHLAGFRLVADHHVPHPPAMRETILSPNIFFPSLEKLNVEDTSISNDFAHFLRRHGHTLGEIELRKVSELFEHDLGEIFRAVLEISALESLSMSDCFFYVPASYRARTVAINNVDWAGYGAILRKLNVLLRDDQLNGRLPRRRHRKLWPLDFSAT